MYILTSVERIVLESLARGGKDTKKIAFDTGLSFSISKATLSLLLMKNLVVQSGPLYSLHRVQISRMRDMQNVEQKQVELKEIFGTLIRKDGNKFKFKKIWLSTHDEILLDAHLEKLDRFLDEVSRKNQIGKRVCDQKIFTYASGNYGRAVSEQLMDV